MAQTQTIPETGACRKTVEGLVVSNKMDRTIVVAVERRSRHKLYHKIIKRTGSFYAHDPQNACNKGDTVRIVETRPLSKTKRWRLDAILRKAR
ncbi:MAG: 30S ribosomal protein S17 [Proteobacteria bacterium]|nr:30S ribosomal protein S17 [Pseudomonadota bacterium]